jgi:hypothetical protein
VANALASRAASGLLAKMAAHFLHSFRTAMCATLVLIATACSELRTSLAEAGGESLCAPVPPARSDQAANGYTQAVQRDECIHRWAYRFAAAPDDADQVVGAVIGACRAQIDRSATMLGGGDDEAERWYLAEMERVAKERALYRVIQARAGNCS